MQMDKCYFYLQFVAQTRFINEYDNDLSKMDME